MAWGGGGLFPWGVGREPEGQGGCAPKVQFPAQLGLAHLQPPAPSADGLGPAGDGERLSICLKGAASLEVSTHNQNKLPGSPGSPPPG